MTHFMWSFQQLQDQKSKYDIMYYIDIFAKTNIIWVNVYFSFH